MDSNQRPPSYQDVALPGCATLRFQFANYWQLSVKLPIISFIGKYVNICIDNATLTDYSIKILQLTLLDLNQ